MKAHDLTGKVFGRLSVIERDREKHKYVKWIAYCSCGSPSKSYLAANLVAGTTTSCGCYQLDKTKEANTRHGHRKEKATKTYAAWSAMLRRCENPKAHNFPSYGGRGVTVTKKWHDFKVFLADMGEAPEGFSLERIDNEKGYFKENCKWATPVEQANNRRSTLFLLFNGEKISLTNAATMLNKHRCTLYSAIFERKVEVEAYLGSGWKLPPAF